MNYNIFPYLFLIKILIVLNVKLVFAQVIVVDDNNKSINQNQHIETPVTNQIRILPDVLFKNIQTKNKTELEILEAKINRIDNSKINKNEISEDQEQEKQRVKQLNILKNQLVEQKNILLKNTNEKQKFNDEKN